MPNDDDISLAELEVAYSQWVNNQEQSEEEVSVSDQIQILNSNISSNPIQEQANEVIRSVPIMPRVRRHPSPPRTRWQVESESSNYTYTNIDNILSENDNSRCFNCGLNLEGVETFISQGIYHFCPDCTRVCSVCGCKMTSMDAYNYRDICYCPECIQEFPVCSWCRNNTPGRMYSDDMVTICRQCHDYASTCAWCERLVHENSARYNNDEDCLCRNCHAEWREGEPIKYYDYRPRPKFKQTGNQHKDKLYFGIELEVYNSKRLISDYSKAKSLCEKYDWMYCKEDSSISRDMPGSGFEIVTHPLSWGWLKTNRQTWDDILGGLREDGYTSYDSATCGIHIHLSKNAFTTFHFYKFLKLFYDKGNYKFIYKISQRCKKSTVGECQWGGYEEKIHDVDTRRKAKQKLWHGRYTAVNLENHATIEIRVFRGTLKYESFYKNIEFLQALYEFTKNASIKDVTVSNFERYVMEKRKEYHNLYNFMGV